MVSNFALETPSPGHILNENNKEDTHKPESFNDSTGKYEKPEEKTI